jgi:hypothetical protein
MDKTEWTITENYLDYMVENALFTYDENEIEQNKINKNNAWLLFTPKFIPFYPKLLELWLTINESLVFWFIDFYLQNSSDKFYFTNEQIWKLFWFWEQNTSLIIKKLKEKWFIDTSYRLKANWWKIRFIKNLYSDYKNFYSPTIKKVIDNNNKINNNNINIINNNTEQSSENQNNSSSINTLALEEKEKSSAKKEKEITAEINDLINQIKNVCDELWVAYNKDMERQFSKHILTAKEYWEFCEKIWQTRVEFALNVLRVSVAIWFFRGALSWPKLIYKHYAELYNQAKQKAPKIQTPTINVL